MNPRIRQPLVVVIGHVDHGKTKLLDTIRGTAIGAGEKGGITQTIGASALPLSVLKKICGNLLDLTKKEITIPGLLFIDSPGHAAFTNLRKRGGNIANIAILVVDINEGFKPQTIESIDILKQYRTPFVVAANKIDLISGWKSNPDITLLKSIADQPPGVQETLSTKLYELVGALHEKGFGSERFDRIEDYTKQVALVPCSAKTREGIPELLMVLVGLAQRFLQGKLTCDEQGFAKGTILEVKDERGLGKTLDVILYDGCLKKNDVIVIGGVDQPVVTKVRALFVPAPLSDTRDKKSKYTQVNEIAAATGIKIIAPDIDAVVSGMPLRSTDSSHLEETRKSVQQEVKEVLIETDQKGIIVKADTLGSLEALTKLLRDKGVAIRSASIGDISKKDISLATSNRDEDPFNCLIVGFNIKVDPAAKDVLKDAQVKTIIEDIIYRIVDEYERWIAEQQRALEAQEFEGLIKPAKIEIMHGYVFRQSNPAVVGVHVLEGELCTGMPLMKDGRTITEVKSIQHEQKSITKAEQGKQVACALGHVTVGRQIQEGDILYSAIPPDDFRKLKELKKNLCSDDIALLKEIAEIMRREEPLWGI